MVSDLERAVGDTGADWVVVSIGNGDSIQKTDIRAASAIALTTVLLQPQHADVKVAVVSSNGAGTSQIKVGLGIGQLIEYRLRHVLEESL